jgi:hypothetical protein
MEVLMFKVKNTIASSLLLIVALTIFSVMLAACGADSGAEAAPIGLRTEAVDDLLGSDDNQTSDTTEQLVVDGASTTEEEAPETEVSLATAVTQTGNGQARAGNQSANIIDPATVVEPSADEIAGLVYMREEEKLARDVYLALYELWGQPVFQNIASSEQTHMDSVLMLLDQYGEADPADGKGPGEFENTILASLYEELVEQGSQSQIEALRVGAAIEELDIVDLEEYLGQTSNEYIIQVYTNLLAGSENHLRAFVSNLERQGGGAYEPVQLEPARYQAIIAGASGNGYRGGSGSSTGSGSDAGSGSGAGNGYGRQNGRNSNA